MSLHKLLLRDFFFFFNHTYSCIITLLVCLYRAVDRYKIVLKTKEKGKKVVEINATYDIYKIFIR